MDIKNIEELLEELDYTELHKLMALPDGYNQIIVVWYDGEIELLGSNINVRSDDEYHCFKTWGFGNLDDSDYAEGWATEVNWDDVPMEIEWPFDDQRLYVNDDTGELMTAYEMVKKCIEEGNWDDFEEGIKEELRYKHDEHIRNQMYNKPAE